MNKSDLYDEVAYQMLLTKKEAKQAVDLVFDLMGKALIAGDEVRIKDFFSLQVVDKAPRKYCLKNMTEPRTTAPGKKVKLSMSGYIMKDIDPAFNPHNKKKGTAEEAEEE